MPAKLLDRLRDWYAAERHRYEFREGRNPYRTWITEIFLQQTQIAAGKEKLKKFLKRFPDVKTLAASPVDDVLAAFQGMGYYSRARNMLKAAVAMVADYRGRVPVSYHELRKIPGIGHYTAAIVASIHGGEKILANDANQARVLSRLFLIGAPQGATAFRAAAEKHAGVFFEGKMPPGDVNEALMQWGQTICKKTPLCEKCFAADFCNAYETGRQREFPQKTIRAEALDMLWILLIRRKGHQYQVVQSGAEFPFLRGEYLFPGFIALPPKGELACLPVATDAALVKKTLKEVQNLPGDFHHTITRYRITVKMIHTKAALPGGTWLTPAELRTRCHSSFMQKALRRLDKLEFT